jgi:hypothetical protein
MQVHDSARTDDLGLDAPSLPSMVTESPIAGRDLRPRARGRRRSGLRFASSRHRDAGVGDESLEQRRADALTSRLEDLADAGERLTERRADRSPGDEQTVTGRDRRIRR